MGWGAPPTQLPSHRSSSPPTAPPSPSASDSHARAQRTRGAHIRKGRHPHQIPPAAFFTTTFRSAWDPFIDPHPPYPPPPLGLGLDLRELRSKGRPSRKVRGARCAPPDLAPHGHHTVTASLDGRESCERTCLQGGARVGVRLRRHVRLNARGEVGHAPPPTDAGARRRSTLLASTSVGWRVPRLCHLLAASLRMRAARCGRRASHERCKSKEKPPLREGGRSWLASPRGFEPRSPD